MLKLAVSASSAVPAPCTAAHRMTPAVIPSASRPGGFDFTYDNGDRKSSWDMKAC